MSIVLRQLLQLPLHYGVHAVAQVTAVVSILA
jgi:hypothetical protein